MDKRGSEEDLAAFLERLANETATSFQATPHSEGVRAVVFLHANRALEAGATLKECAESLGIALARANLSPDLESLALDELEVLSPILSSVHEGA